MRHDASRRPPLLARARVGPPRGRRSAVIGITSFAADELGDIVYVELPAVGATLTQFASFGVVECVKAVSDLFAPVSGDGGRGQRGPARQPGAHEQRPARRGLDREGDARRRRRAGALLDAAGYGELIAG